MIRCCAILYQSFLPTNYKKIHLNANYSDDVEPSSLSSVRSAGHEKINWLLSTYAYSMRTSRPEELLKNLLVDFREARLKTQNQNEKPLSCKSFNEPAWAVSQPHTIEWVQKRKNRVRYPGTEPISLTFGYCPRLHQCERFRLFSQSALVLAPAADISKGKAKSSLAHVELWSLLLWDNGCAFCCGLDLAFWLDSPFWLSEGPSLGTAEHWVLTLLKERLLKPPAIANLFMCCLCLYTANSLLCRDWFESLGMCANRLLQEHSQTKFQVWNLNYHRIFDFVLQSFIAPKKTLDAWRKDATNSWSMASKQAMCVRCASLNIFICT